MVTPSDLTPRTILRLQSTGVTSTKSTNPSITGADCNQNRRIMILYLWVICLPILHNAYEHSDDAPGRHRDSLPIGHFTICQRLDKSMDSLAERPRKPRITMADVC